MTAQQSSYRQIIKATSLFGGVQVFNILISIVRSKFIAVLLGTNGMGILGLLNSTLSLVGSVTNMGLGTSAVKDIAAANSSEDTHQIAVTTTVFRRLVWFTGTVGSLIVLIFSPWLSDLTFGNKNYTFAFIWISVTLLFSQLTNGQLAILQGIRKLKQLAQANLLGSSLGLIVTLPLYYYWGVDGIVPGIIGASVITLIISIIYARKVKIKSVDISFTKTLTEGKNMLNMGFMVSLGGLMSTADAYLIRIFISNVGGVEQVGLYTAGMAIINIYMGLVLKGMATDYYPRLSSAADNNTKFRNTINSQTEIGLLIMAPMLIVFIVFINWAIILLYSKQFLAITNMMLWAALGMFFRVPNWALGFVFLAKGKSALYFYLQLFSHILLLVLSAIGYYFWGLTGVGISLLVVYPLYLLVIYRISQIRYNFTFEYSSVTIFTIQFCLGILAFLSIKHIEKPINTIFGILFILLSVFYSLKQLNKKTDIYSWIRKYFKIKNDKSKED
jgi:O-antigen/teichoic acid export membrane protein